ncbi:MAG: succinate dehydrogenase/fumarate reductase iron-sulfur subunit [Cellulomonadaceae bacterium]|jgi:fumarate reductase iron-sulfur subunit|nr:succinate dehydrogenase/fumarate reductase iron-sulfur subunit [Cellulomonadaceae bacterium]
MPDHSCDARLVEPVSNANGGAVLSVTKGQNHGDTAPRSEAATVDATVRVTVLRQEPTTEASPQPREESWDVPFTETTTVLDALTWIKDHADPSLTFRWSCRSAVCGSCGVMVNGQARLGCETFVSGYATSGVRVTPMDHAEVQRDLAVDHSGFVEKMASLKPWMMPEPHQDVLAELASMHTQSPSQAAEYAHLSQCIGCGLCLAACPVLAEVSEFVGPAAIATAQRWDKDSRDSGAEQRFELMVDNEFGIWPCTQEMHCTRVCPQGVDPAATIIALQRNALTGM